MRTEQQTANLHEAIRMWETVPERNVYPYLDDWVKVWPLVEENPDCDTVACFGGWCACWPEFKKQGMLRLFGGRPSIDCQTFFGDGSLYGVRGSHVADTCFKGSDHALVMNRLKWALEHP